MPEQHDYTDPTVEQNPGRLHAWLTNLPLLNVVETVRQVLDALHALNEQKLPLQLRMELLGIFRDTVQRLFVTVDPLRLRQLALDRVRREQAREGVERLLLAMAGGYKIIVMACNEPGAMRASGPLFGLALNHTMEQLGYVLLDSYRCYRSVPESVFSELHQLYRLARHHGLLEVTAGDGEETGGPQSTAALYHAALLLSLMDPSRLAEGEAGLFYEVIRHHAGHCRIVPGNQWSGAGEGLFLVDLKGDSPPVPCWRVRSPLTAQEPYLLDARDALAVLGERLERIPAKVRRQSPEARVLRRLLPEKPDPRRHREPRHTDGRRVGLLIGLDNIHAFQSNRSTPRQADAGSTGAGAAGGPSGCRVLDTSKGGMCLELEDAASGEVRVGELLAVVEEDRRPVLATIRSVQVRREGGVEIGIQLLAGISAPVYCRAREDAEGHAQRALFLHACEAEDISATLVVAKGFYRPGRRLLIDAGGKAVPACAGRSITDAPLFDRFEFAADSG